MDSVSMWRRLAGRWSVLNLGWVGGWLGISNLGWVRGQLFTHGSKSRLGRWPLRDLFLCLPPKLPTRLFFRLPFVSAIFSCMAPMTSIRGTIYLVSRRGQIVIFKRGYMLGVVQWCPATPVEGGNLQLNFPRFESRFNALGSLQRSNWTLSRFSMTFGFNFSLSTFL